VSVARIVTIRTSEERNLWNCIQEMLWTQHKFCSSNRSILGWGTLLSFQQVIRLLSNSIWNRSFRVEDPNFPSERTSFIRSTRRLSSFVPDFGCAGNPQPQTILNGACLHHYHLAFGRSRNGVGLSLVKAGKQAIFGTLIQSKK
jgi:hypothetical protein